MKKVYIFTLSSFLLFGTACQDKSKKEDTQEAAAPQNMDAHKYRTELSQKKADLRQKLSKANEESANKLLVEYQKIFDNILDSLNYAEKNILSNSHLWDNFDEQTDSLQQKIKQYENLDLYFHPIDSTSLELRFKPSFYYKTFQRKVSEDVREFLLLQLSMQLNEYEHENLSKSLELQRTDLLKWEDFLTKYPESAYYTNARERYHQLIKTYWYGSDNQQHVSFSAKTMTPEFEQEIITLVKEHPKKITTKISKRYADFFLNKSDSHTADILEKEVKQYNQSELEKSFR